MIRLEDRFPWLLLIISALLIASAFLWVIEAISGNQNVIVSVLFIIGHLLGAWVCYSMWQKRKQKQ